MLGAGLRPEAGQALGPLAQHNVVLPVAGASLRDQARVALRSQPGVDESNNTASRRGLDLHPRNEQVRLPHSCTKNGISLGASAFETATAKLLGG
jgi:hypothetical protein